MNAGRKWSLAVACMLAAVQFVPVHRANPPVESEPPAPAEVKAVLKRSCYDCHSHETRWPWYARVAPASWLVAHDVNEAREELNFSRWNAMTAVEQKAALESIVKEMREGDMPLPQYLWLHPEARPGAEGIRIVADWARTLSPAE